MAAPRESSDGMDEDFPTEIQDRLNDFDEALTKVETCVQSLLSKPLSEVHENLSPLDKAKIDLISAYTINSLFWMYLNVKGINPKEHGVKQELGSIRQYMTRAKQIQDRAKAPRLNTQATNRFLRNALWSLANKEEAKVAKEESSEDASTSVETPNAKAAKKALWKAAHNQARQVTEEPAADAEPSPGKRKKEERKHGKKKQKKR